MNQMTMSARLRSARSPPPARTHPAPLSATVTTASGRPERLLVKVGFLLVYMPIYINCALLKYLSSKCVFICKLNGPYLS